MKILIVSMSRLFTEALQMAIKEKRSNWQVDIYIIQAPIFHQVLVEKIKENRTDIVVIETTNQYFLMLKEGLNKLNNLKTDIVLLLDSRIGEIYHHLKDEDQWMSVTKNNTLDEFLTILKSARNKLPTLPQVSLMEVDKMILKELALGQTFDFIQRTRGLTAEQLDQVLYRINTYFQTPNYIESISKAFEQNIIQIGGDIH